MSTPSLRAGTAGLCCGVHTPPTSVSLQARSRDRCRWDESASFRHLMSVSGRKLGIAARNIVVLADCLRLTQMSTPFTHPRSKAASRVKPIEIMPHNGFANHLRRDLPQQDDLKRSTVTSSITTQRPSLSRRARRQVHWLVSRRRPFRVSASHTRQRQRWRGTQAKRGAGRAIQWL